MSRLQDHPSYGLFVQGFLDEHLFEIGFLLNQRRAMLADPAAPWTGNERNEQRVMGHLGAMAAWGKPALEAARGALEDDDDYLFLAAVFLLASLGDADELEKLRQRATNETRTARRALAEEALRLVREQKALGTSQQGHVPGT